MLVGPVDVLAPVQHGRELGAMGPLVGHDRVGLQDGFEPLAGAAALVPDSCEMFEVTGDLAFVPGGQDRLEVGEVLVQGGAPDAGLLGDLRHRHRRQPVLGDQCRMPTPISFVVTRLANMNAPVTMTKRQAEPIITLAVFSNPLSTAARLSFDCSHSSPIELSRNTS